MSALLPERMVAKPWGCEVLPAPFTAPPGQRIGEIWFEPPAALDQLLVKYIFTSEKLSVQVHPSDEQALVLGGDGKEECWLVTAAEPGAVLGIGFRAALSAGDLRAAALDGSIEQLLVWHPVAPGDFFYIPAGTVHAIGPGVGLIEVQQNSDATYRLFDYGRPRELHLDAAVAVARAEPYADPRRCRVPARGAVVLVDGPLFRLLRYDGPLDPAAPAWLAPAPVLVIPSAGTCAVGGEAVAAGQCALAAGPGDLVIAAGALGLIAQPVSRP